MFGRKKVDSVPQTPETPAVAAMSLEQFRTALNALPLGVVIFSAEGAETWRSRGVYALIGDGPAADDINELISSLSTRAVRGHVTSRILEVVGPPARTVELRTVPLVNGGGLVVVEDLTERVLTDRVRTDFVANISHELKTPIGALSVLTDAIRAELESGDETLRRLADRMIDETSRVARIIDDLLELASIEFVGISRREDVDVTRLLAEVVSRFEHVARAKNVSLNLVNAQERVIASVDSRQIQTAVSNLVENAIKYTDAHGSVAIEGRISEGSLIIVVHDTGVGIPAEHLDRIFERFYRVDVARSRGTGGTGLGLAIVRHVATNHGGEVNVRSQLGEGSTFTLRIPLSLA